MIQVLTLPHFRMQAQKSLSQQLEDPYAFAATLFRLSFAFLFLLVAMKQFRMGITNFAETLVMSDTLLTQDVPHVIIFMYGLALPILEFLVGVLLLVNRDVKSAYGLAGIIYLSFIFGQVYSGFTPRIGSEYFPSMIALVIAYFCEDKVGTSLPKPAPKKKSILKRKK